MNVKLIAHTQLSEDFQNDLFDNDDTSELLFDIDGNTKYHGQAVALTAIRTCYSPGKPSEIIAKEGAKYFGNGGTEADRLFRMIVRSGHTSTLEHLSFTFAIEGVSRALLAQLTRHRVGFSYSVQSQRYVKFGSDDRSGGMDFVTPESVIVNSAGDVFENAMVLAQSMYDQLRALGVPAEDARAVLPNAAACNLVMTANLRALLEFYSKRKPGNGAQKEITELAVALKDAVISVEPWTAQFFEAEAK
jgi:thymidylate synthase (FAD)